jgi:hypothetical protein
MRSSPDFVRTPLVQYSCATKNNSVPVAALTAFGAALGTEIFDRRFPWEVFDPVLT